MVGWHHQLNRHEFELILGDSGGQWMTKSRTPLSELVIRLHALWKILIYNVSERQWLVWDRLSHTESKSFSVMSDSLWPRGLVYGILQAKILEWVVFPFSMGSSQPRDWTQVFPISGSFFTSWATRVAHESCFYKYDTGLHLMELKDLDALIYGPGFFQER